MTLAQKIESIPDGALFEKIAVDILRIKHPEYWNIIHSGVNSKNEAVKSPLDAFMRLPNGNFILIEATKTKIGGLRSKWLDPKDGDLIKAGQKAEVWRKEFPNAKYIVWLCTNLRIKDNGQKVLFTKVEEKAKELNLSIEYLEQSAIVSFLENTPDGQWIAEKHLGIKAVRMSIPKFIELSQQNLKSYQSEIFFNDKVVIERNNVLNLENNTHHLLIGNSGVGKSTYLFSQAIHFQDSNNKKYVIRLEPDIVLSSISVKQAIFNQLKRIQTDIYISDDFFSILNFNRILIIVDDINRHNNPVSIINRLATWETESFITLIIPIWQKVYNQLPGRFKESEKSLFRIAYLDKYSKDEAYKAINRIALEENVNWSLLQKEQIVKELSYSPFLIGLYQLNLDRSNWFNSTKFPIEKYIERQIRCVEQNNNDLLYAEIQEAISDLCFKMLHSKTFSLSLSLLKKWFDKKDTYTIIRKIIKQNTLLFANQDGLVQFKHDKIRDYLLTKELQRLILSQEIETSILYEPFFAELIGKAIGTIDEELSESFVINLLDNLPLAVFESLRYNQNDKSNFHNQLIDWLKVNSKKLNPSVSNTIEYSLKTLEYSNIETILHYFDKSILSVISNFRNGNTIAGATFFSFFNKNDFEPISIHSERDKLIENFRCHHLEKGLIDLRRLMQLPKLSNEQKKGLILFSGHLEAKELFNDIYNLWLTSKEILLTETIWALIKTLDDDFETILKTVFDYLGTLPKGEKTNFNLPKETRYWTNLYLSKIQWKQFTQKLITFLSDTYNNPKLEDISWTILINIDNHLAFKIVIEKLAKVAEQSFINDTSNLFSHFFIEKWNPTSRRGKQMSDKSLVYLQQVWEDQTNNRFLREQSFRLWKASCNSKHLEILKTINDTDEIIFKESLYKRLKLNDKSVFSEVKNYISKKPKRYYVLIPYLAFIWNETTLNYIDELIEEHRKQFSGELSNDSSWVLSEISKLLKYIPEEDFDILLKKHHSFLKNHNAILITAFLQATELSQKFIADVIENSKNPKSHFKYFTIYLADYTEFTVFKNEPITVQVLKCLKPYFQYLEQRGLFEIANRAVNNNLHSWVKNNMAPFLKDESKHYVTKQSLIPTKSDLKEEFLEIMERERYKFSLDDWINRLPKRGYNKNDFIIILKEWLSDINLNDTFFEGIAECLLQIGNRQDFAILQKTVINEKREKIFKDKQYELFRKVLK